MAKVSNCNAHCQECDQCFSGDSLFDAHFVVSKKGGVRSLKCANPAKKKLHPHDGLCLIKACDQADPDADFVSKPVPSVVWSSVPA